MISPIPLFAQSLQEGVNAETFCFDLLRYLNTQELASKQLQTGFVQDQEAYGFASDNSHHRCRVGAASSSEAYACNHSDGCSSLKIRLNTHCLAILRLEVSLQLEGGSFLIARLD